MSNRFKQVKFYGLWWVHGTLSVTFRSRLQPSRPPPVSPERWPVSPERGPAPPPPAGSILRFNDATSPSAWHTNTTGQRWEVGHKQTRRQPLFWIVLCAVCVKARILSRIPWTYFYSLWRAITLLSRFHFASSLKGPVIINILDYDLWTLHTWPKFCYFYIWTNRSKNYTLLHYTDILWNHTTD